MAEKPQVAIIGGGMITQVQILPSIYHLQRENIVGDISVCALDSAPLKTLAEDKSLEKAFPSQTFTAYPSLDISPDKKFPELFKEVFQIYQSKALLLSRCLTSFIIWY